MTRATAARVLRQVLVLGEAGQARVSAATAQVQARGFAGDVHALYAERAGFGGVEREVAPHDGQPYPNEANGVSDVAALESETAREMLAGARAAVRAIRAASEGGQ